MQKGQGLRILAETGGRGTQRSGGLFGKDKLFTMALVLCYCLYSVREGFSRGFFARSLLTLVITKVTVGELGRHLARRRFLSHGEHRMLHGILPSRIRARPRVE